MTFGFTLTRTASKTSRPARSMAVARWKVSPMLALSAEISARTTRSMLPPARKWASISPMFKSRPALVALIRGLMMRRGFTLRKRMPIIVPKLTLTPEKKAVIHKPTGTKTFRSMRNRMIPTRVVRPVAIVKVSMAILLKT